MIQKHLLFLRTIEFKARLFGSKLEFSLPKQPGHAQNIGTLRSTKSDSPGMESVNFYDAAYDPGTGCYYNVGLYPQMLGSETIEPVLEKDIMDSDRLVCFRRIFLSSFYTGYGSDEESYWFDIFMHRHPGCGDLNDPNNLKRAHHQLWALSLVDEPVDDASLMIEGVDWQLSRHNGLNWLRYQEFTGAGLRGGQSWLLAIGPNHYIRLHIYRLNPSATPVSDWAFRRFAAACVKRFQVRLQKPVAALDFANEPYFRGMHTLPKWYEVMVAAGEELRRGDIPKSSWLNRNHWLAGRISTLFSMLFSVFMLASLVAGIISMIRWLQLQDPWISEIVGYAMIAVVVLNWVLGALVRKLSPKPD